MKLSTSEERRRLTALEPHALESHQLARLNSLLAQIIPANPYYATKLAEYEFPLRSLDDLSGLPYTYKEGLLSSKPGEMAANLTFPLTDYVRFHQTSGTRGRPL